MASPPRLQTEQPYSTTSDLLEELRRFAKYKERSDLTHDQDHAPVLAQGKPITCLLLGHSFFERFKTTGCSTRFGPPQAQYPEFFNAGVGGDSISNVIYRLIEKGLLAALKQAGVRYALLAMGTNDLTDDKRPLQDKHIEQYVLIIRALQWACPGIRILVSALAPKRRVKKQGIVEESNIKLQAMVEACNKNDPNFRGLQMTVIGVAMANISTVDYLPPQPELIDHLEPDGVHLNRSGYELFAESLWQGYQNLTVSHEQP